MLCKSNVLSVNLRKMTLNFINSLTVKTGIPCANLASMNTVCKDGYREKLMQLIQKVVNVKTVI